MLHPFSQERAGTQPPSVRALTGNGRADRVKRSAATEKPLRAYARVSIKRWRQPAIDAVIAELGPDRVLAALDRLNGNGGES